MFEGVSPELVKELPQLIIFVLALGWIMRKIQNIVAEYNKMIFDMSSECREAHKEIATQHREAIKDLVSSNAKGVEALTKMLSTIEDTVVVSKSRIDDIHSVVVKKKK